jgi:histidyl-tRNA synthetase
MLPKISTPAPVLVTWFDRDRLADYVTLSTALRGAGLGVEVFPEPKKLGQQLKYADRRGHRVALIAGSNEFEAGTVQIKDLVTGEKTEAAFDGADIGPLVAAIEAILGS